MTQRDRVRQSAYRILARRTHSSFELSRKLRRRFDASLVDQIVEELQQKGYLDDLEAALERALHCRRVRHYGDRRIAADLTARGIDAKIVEVALAQVNQQHSEAECLRELVSNWLKQKGRPETAGQLKKLYDHGMRRGFPAPLLRQVLAPFFAEVSWSS